MSPKLYSLRLVAAHKSLPWRNMSRKLSACGSSQPIQRLEYKAKNDSIESFLPLSKGVSASSKYASSQRGDSAQQLSHLPPGEGLSV
jgi:hypothetical protein